MKTEVNNIESCSCNVIHGEIVNSVKEKLPEDETLYDLAELFKVFGDSTRIKILYTIDYFSVYNITTTTFNIINFSFHKCAHSYNM